MVIFARQHGFGSPRGGEDKAEGQGGGDEGEEGKGGGEYTTPPLEYPPIGTVTPHKRKVSPQKPLARKKMSASKSQLEATIMEDDISLVHRAMENASEDIL